MHLHGPPGDVVEHLRHDDLGRGDVLAHPLVVVVLVDLPRRVQHEQPELRELGVGVGDVALHELLVGQQAALGLPAQRPLAHHVERLLGQPDRAHGVVDAASAQTGLGDDEGLALAAEEGVGGDPDVLVMDQSVGALVQALAAQSQVAFDVDAGRVGWHQEHRHSLVRADIGVGHGHHDQERRRLGVGGEELPAVDDPLVAVLDGARLEQRGVGARVGLGHRVAGEQLAVEQRLEVALLLLGRAVVGDDLGVAGVRRLAAEHDRRPLRPPQDLVQQGQLELAVALAAELGTEVGGPQPLAANLLLQGVDDLAPRPLEGLVLLVPPDEVERLDLLAHEPVSPVQLLLELGLGFEVPRHGHPSSVAKRTFSDFRTRLQCDELLVVMEQ